MEVKCSLFWKFACIFLALTLPQNNAELNGPEVSLAQGKLRGKWMLSDKGARIAAFLGIPYAKPPVKHLRFQAPEPSESWEGTLDASEDGHSCIQFDFLTQTLTGDEDCLFLNIYKPEVLKSDDALPVMVFIHGGGYLCGTGSSSTYGPQRLLDKDIVLVTINYRLGIFGYLSTDDEEAPGNYGMLDQVAALRWVQQNIAHFQGDPDRVTIFGESAGGASVTLHMLSPLSKGLFHAAIPESGTAISVWSLQPNLKNYAEKVATRLQCPTSNTKVLVKCLRRQAALDIVVKSTFADLQSFKNEKCGLLQLGPTIDSIRGHLAFLPESPQSLLSKGKFYNVPTLSGVTKDEGAFLLLFFVQLLAPLNFTFKEQLSAVLSKLIPNIEDEKMAEKVNKILTKAYFQGYDNTNIMDSLTALCNVYSDLFMDCSVDEFNKLIAAHGAQIYAYRFAYKGEFAYTDKFLHLFPSVTSLDFVGHLDELQYLFRCAYFKSTHLSDEDMKMVDIMTTLWTNFAKNLKPSLDGSSYRGSVTFEPVTPSLYQYLDIDKKIKMVEDSLCRKPKTLQEIVSLFSAKDEL